MTISCPRCLQHRDPENPALACSRCEPVEDDTVSGVLGRRGIRTRPLLGLPEGRRTILRDGDPFEVDCPTCRIRTRAIEVCPLCHQPYPPGWTALGGTTTVALAGARNAGKTVYIDVLAACLAGLSSVARERGMTLLAEPYDKATEEADRGSRQRMWGDRRAPHPTAPRRSGAPPLSRKYLLTRSAGGVRDTHCLVLQDIAGEDLSGVEEGSAEYFRFIGRVDLLIFLVDPVQILKVRNRIAPYVALPTEDVPDPVTILRNVVRLQGAGDRGGGVPVRTAVVLAKFDNIHQLAAADDFSLSRAVRSPGFAFNRDPGARQPNYEPRDGVLLDLEVRSLLDLLGAREFLTYVDIWIPSAQFFAVSALGHQPRGRKLAPSGVTAFRVLDPVKWALADTGILDPPPVQR